MVRLAVHKNRQPQFAFISSNSAGKADPETRLSIRKHVMLGKNRNKKRDEKNILKSWVNQGRNKSLQLSPINAPSYFPLPKQLGSDLLVTQFACDMPSYGSDLVYKYFTIIGQAAYPIDFCHKFDVKSSVYVKYLAIDVLFCYSVLWTSLAYFDWLQGSDRSVTQIKHANQTLSALQQRLYDSQLATSDSTICVVVCLVTTSALVGDYESARRHMVGLTKMVDLRGGLGAFKENGQVQLKLCRADLTVALLTYSKPMFMSDDLSWEPYINKRQESPYTSFPKGLFIDDQKVRHIWLDLQEFNNSANLALQTRHKMDHIVFTEILISVQYRLMLLDMQPESTDSTICAGMLAFSTNVFLQIKGLAIPFQNVFAQLRGSIMRSDFNYKEKLEFRLWLLFVTRVCVVAETESAWLRNEMSNTLEALNLPTWKIARERLKKYLWIDVLHDECGRKAFEKAIQKHE